MSGVKKLIKKAAPVIGAVGGFVLGGPAGAMAGFQAGSAVSGAMNASDAAKAQNAQAGQFSSEASQLQAMQLQDAIQHREYEKGLLEQDRGMALGDYERRLGIADEMMSAATFSPEFYDQQIGGATAAVRSSMGRARESEMRDMSRYGINPASGRAAGMNTRYALSGAAAEAGAANAARFGLGAEERSRQDSARVYAAGITPQIVGHSVSNPVASIYGQHSDHAHNMSQAAQARADAHKESKNDLFGQVIGMGFDYAMNRY